MKATFKFDITGCEVQLDVPNGASYIEMRNAFFNWLYTSSDKELFDAVTWGHASVEDVTTDSN